MLWLPEAMNSSRISRDGLGSWAPQHAAPSSMPAWLGAVALQDAILLGFLVIVRVLLAGAEPGLARSEACRLVEAALALIGTGVVVGRVIPSIPAGVRSVVYRVSIVGALLLSYLMLRDVLPVIRADSLDAALTSLDARIFGVVPAVWMQRFNTRAVVEYFSFFYFSYFFLLVGFMVVVIWLERIGRHTATFAIGTLAVYGLGQLGYLLVPGFGPYVHLAGSFAGPLDGGFFWGLVSQTVAAGGAMKDIFPSLHTAAPTWFTLYAIHRAARDRRWLTPAIVVGFFAANIIVSTMLLRWHYAVDVMAGLVLAVSVGLLAPRLARWEEARRARFGHPQPFRFEPETAARS